MTVYMSVIDMIVVQWYICFLAESSSNGIASH